MRRAFIRSTQTASALVVASQIRTHYWFSAASEHLKSLQTTRGFKYDMWVDDKEAKYRGFIPREGEQPFLAQVPACLELYNMQDVVIPPTVKAETLPPVAQHTSFSSRKPYGKTMQEELEARASTQAYDSKYWITPQAVRKHQYKLAPKAKSALILQINAHAVYNVAQFQQPEAVYSTPISGGTSRVLASTNLGADVSAHRQLNSFETAVYFTENHLKALNLVPLPDAVPLRVKLDEGTTRLRPKSTAEVYNIAQALNYKTLQATLPQTDTHHIYNGARFFRVSSPSLLAKFVEAEAKFPGSKIWVFATDVAKTKMELAPQTESIDVSGVIQQKEGGATPANLQSSNDLLLFNVDQLLDRAVAKAAVGCYVR